jgi:N-ethylmaleimide reductase
LPVAPSAIRIEGQQHYTPMGLQDYEVPRALTTEEIQAIVDDFEKGARNAKAAGFDGVELHGAFGYLPHQFLVDASNQRTDAYGGSIENRVRFVLEVMDRLVGVWGAGRVGIRLSPTLAYNGMVDSDPRATFGYLIEKLDALPLAYLHLMRATPDAARFPHWPQDALAAFGPLFRGPIVVNGAYDRDAAEAVVTSGAAHAVSFGAPFIANPDLVHRLAIGAPLAEGDRNTFYGGREQGYVDYPALSPEPHAAPKGYWLVFASITNPEKFGAYKAAAGPVLATFGARVLASGEVAEVVEGAIAHRPYFVEYPSYAAAKAAFHSAGYQDAIALRSGAATFDIVIVEGLAGAHVSAR